MDTFLAAIVLDQAQAVLWSDIDQDAPEFIEAIELIRAGVEAGHISYAGALAEVLALDGPHHDARMAYKCYYLVAALESLSVQYDNRSNDPALYCGPEGDFRHGGMVAGLIEELGAYALPLLDAEAASILATEI